MSKQTSDTAVLVQAQDLVREYGTGPAAVQAVNGVSLEVFDDEILAIMGPSGCGKSTLLHLLSGLDAPRSGSIRIDGKDILALRGTEKILFRRQYCGFVFQNLMLIPPATVYENVEVPLILAGVPRDIREKQVPEILEQVGMSEFAHHLPDELSGGQQQRVGIARALVHTPRIVFADEPTSNLDSTNAQLITELLVRIAKQKQTTVILVTHDPAVAEHADRILRLHSGKIDQGDTSHNITAKGATV
jgi:ABC-type lipoprotein export system ATPase subunit